MFWRCRQDILGIEQGSVLRGVSWLEAGCGGAVGAGLAMEMGQVGGVWSGFWSGRDIEAMPAVLARHTLDWC